MRPNRLFVILIALLLITSSFGKITFAFNPVPPDNHTLLAVKQDNGQWGDARTIHSLTTLSFQWKSDVPNANYGQWQLFDYPPGPNDATAQPFAASGPLTATPVNQFKPFTIDFAQIRQQHPDKFPSVPPATPKDCYVRMVPWKTQDTTNPANIAGHVSLNMKITYVSSTITGPGQGPTVIGVEITRADVSVFCPIPAPGSIVAFVVSSKPSSLLFQVSETAPMLDPLQHPLFSSGTVAASEHIVSLNTRHLVGLYGLKVDTHYYYIIEAKDSAGNEAFTQGEFQTGSR
jgi:hypothetical protein